MMHIYEDMWRGYVHIKYRYTWSMEDGIRSHRARVTDDCEPSTVGAGNEPQVLYKSSMSSWLLNRLSSVSGNS